MQAFEEEHINKLRPYLSECMVLLKSDGAFPLEGSCRIAAFGNGVWDTVKGGSGSGEVNSRYFVTVGHGLEHAGFEIVNKDWQDQYAKRLAEAKSDFRKEVRRKAKEQKVNVIVASMGAVLKQPEYEIELDLSADAAIYVVARLSGEGNDRLPEPGDFMLTASEVRDILALDSAYEKFMLIINTGGPVDLTPVADVRNILVMSQLGVEAGNAVADVLIGKSYPSGKLATTWAAYEDYCSVGDFAERDDTRYREGIFVGYRYFDAARKKPLFPFGYGLGYTTFSVGAFDCACSGSVITVRTEVLNAGDFRGKETLQVYVSCSAGTLVREVKSLAGFTKTRELAPGEGETVEVAFDIRDLAGYAAKSAQYVLEAGTYVVLAGMSSADVEPCATFELERTVVVKQVKNLFGSIDFEDATFGTGRGDASFPSANLPMLNVDAGYDDSPFSSAGLPTLSVDVDAFEQQVVSYEGAGEDVSGNASVTIPELALLSDEDLAYLNMGAFNPKGGALSVIGNASQSVAGAAGESTMQLADKGIGNLVMADGPAGLRLAREFYEDDKGVHAVGLTIPESMLDLLPSPVKRLLTRKPRLKKGVVLQEQFTTALPIATAIAQSFNVEFAELCGDIVGAEMDLYGVDLWLAPALNIHRNVLCGRNFEYYSEDPLVSGLFAAALTRGVQKHAGRGVTLKHFAANNQETNRYASNSMVSERALREIYLRGFEICIHESAPLAVMTSYNLINGVHTSESRDLTTALRCEFGFDGVIMTDWIIGGDFLTGETKYAAPDPAKVAAAGCSLYMPGSKNDYEALLVGLKAGVVSRKTLVENASWLVRVIWGAPRG